MSGKSRLHCAIYTRKSTEDGLEQEFNSLDAQREACAAFITSQVGLGWKLVPEHYDDGGISGGTMERPALQCLLADIAEGKVDVVVVYKIDRLTRSLIDFARIVEIFDRHDVSFVSVTQQFNTTTSMGRLTLNVLLSFAQFEREVTAERIRDKIAASKKKGMWMGGTVPLGYRVENRKLVIDKIAASAVRNLFKRYLQLGSVPTLARELNDYSGTDGTIASLLRADSGQGRRRPASRIGKGKLYYMLSNPIYAGRIRHGSAIYAGEHQAIIDDGTFEAVQKRLAEQSPRPRGVPVQRDIHLLNGLLFDETGDRLSPIHASKADKRYRYYISSRLKENGSERKDGWRVPAAEIEAIVLQQLTTLLADKVRLASWIDRAGQSARIEVGLDEAVRMSDRLKTCPWSSPNLRELIYAMVQRIDVAKGRIRIKIDTASSVGWLMGSVTAADNNAAVSPHAGQASCVSRAEKARAVRTSNGSDLYVIELPLSIRQRGVERRLVIYGQTASLRRPDRPLIETLARAHAYLKALTDGQGLTRKDVAEQFGVHPEDVSRLLPLAFLSPRIVEAILTGQQPADLSVRHLARGIDLPISWAEQGRLLEI
ncbi:MAG: recombinase family protein [Hyphomicrobiales bacterium]|nr:recombinase family protein [Hyphomicrobiales bacterium]